MTGNLNSEQRAVLLRYHEIALKRGKRAWFEEKLGTNAKRLIHRAAGADALVGVQRRQGRIIVRTHWNERVQEALSRVFGLTSFSPMLEVPTEKQTIFSAAEAEFDAHVKRHGQPANFRVETRRSDKVFAETSVDLDRELGSRIKARYPEVAVRLEKPVLTLGVEIHREKTYIWTEKLPGPGGLPVGTNGHLLALLSGGLDSPVAAIRMLKRGATTSFVHFHGTPYVGDDVLEKVEDLARIVNRFQPQPKPLHVIPFGKIQEKVALAVQPKFRTVLYRRLMVRISCELASRIGAQALVTGESLGQVASQTVENMSTIDATTKLPILRPLLAMDKDEIIRSARAYETFETAIRPGLDCCTLFADRHPSIRTRLDQAEKEESRFDVQEFVNEALAQVEIKTV